jgi:hypothetical protein
MIIFTCHFNKLLLLLLLIKNKKKNEMIKFAYWKLNEWWRDKNMNDEYISIYRERIKFTTLVKFKC